MNREKDLLKLLDLAKTGDDVALDALLREVQPQLFRFSMNMCRHREDAEDVLQDSMLSLARSFRDFRGASSISTWLYVIARNLCIKKRRKGKYEPSHEESLEHLRGGDFDQLRSSSPTPQESLESTEFWKQIQAGIKNLEPDYREVLVLRDIEGLRAKEVSDIIGISVAAVKSRLHRARADLRQNLANAPYRPNAGCPDIRRIFSEHLEGDLSPMVCSTMEAHVADCPACASECDGLKSALNACSSAPIEMSEQVKERVQTALRVFLKKK